MLVHTSSKAARVACRATRRTSVRVYNVFSLSRAVSNLREHSRQSAGAATLEAPATSNLHPRKAVQGVPVQDRDTVELIMALTSLDSKPSNTLVREQHPHYCICISGASCSAAFFLQEFLCVLTADVL